MEPTNQAPPKVKHKEFRYHTQLEWTGKRAGILRCEGKPEWRVSSPPEFKGEPGIWTPGDLFVAAIQTCTMTTFLAFAQKLGLPLVSYSCRAEGLLEFSEGGYRFTTVILRPAIVVEKPEAVEQAEKTLSDAHKSCLISNSARTRVLVEPTIQAIGS